MANLSSTGIDGLDYILRGGLPNQSVTLIQGPAGVGKTTAAIQFLCAGVKQGEKCLMISVAQTRDEVVSIARSHGFDTEGIIFRTVDLREGERDEHFVLDTNESDLTDLLEQVYSLIDEFEPDRLVFDSLLELRLLAPDNMHYRREILKLKRYLVNKNISAYVVDYNNQQAINDGRIGAGPGVTDSQVIEGIVQGVISLGAVTPRIGTTHRRIRIKKFRGHSFVEGYHDFDVRTGGVTVFPRVIPRDLPPKDLGQPLATGLDNLNRMLGGGLEPASTTLISGQSGTGKSTLSTVFATACAARDVDAGLFLFEERPEIYRDRSEGVGLEVSKYEDEKRLYFHHFDPSEISAGEFCQTVISKVEEDDLGLVVIDSLSGYLSAIAEPEYILSQIQSLVQYLARQGVIVIVVMSQHGLLGEQPRSDIDVSFLADSVIQLCHTPSGSEIRRTITVLKKRHSTHERRIKNFIIAPARVDIEDMSSDTLVQSDVDRNSAGDA